ncbi:MAG: hypothetical protein AB8G99_03860 [Planctomycetaceae bacterium]
MNFLNRNRKREKAPDHVVGAFFGGFVGLILGLMAIAAMRNAGMEPGWENSLAVGGVVGSAIGARWPGLATLVIECFQAFFP